MDITEHQRRTYEAVLGKDDAPFVLERPPLFSPAAAAQDEANTRGSFGRFAQTLLPLEYVDWTEESAAHVETCYLGDWSSLSKVAVRGPEALAFLSGLGMNDLSRFETGQIKHHVQLDEHGRVASEGVLCKLGDEEFVYTAGSCDWLRWQFSRQTWDAEVLDITPEWFIFGVQGPESLRTLEKATGESLGDIAFNRSRGSRVGEAPVRILRTGISGELGYEVHGSPTDADSVWKAVAAAGAESGIRLLGFRSQAVQHIEAGIATNGLDYLPAAIVTPGAPRQFRRGKIGGSFVPANGVSDYFRKPGELGWGPRKRLPAHDFTGRAALAADVESGGPSRGLVGLTWNSSDVTTVFAALFDGSVELPEQMDIPRYLGPSFDQVLVGDAPVGVSTGRTVSTHLRATISLCVLDRAHAEPGTEVTVVWGSPGTPQREIRATVTALPFKPDRRRTLP
ncbi:aminomethyl transferase family protein [Amycolatopsis acidicola]|uniref:Aminomethyl transferase family protein n=1 Tax=Amycolatopsis acidicola TaxID=2596893 RepID=A0A5N0VIB9_9PSEU|nr:aminomethyltransferase family protein [Amycolatopsis acidicola]KAA9166127.1 aminomethyl transferase family protein [Amycolatopsis acidicola]